MEHDPVAGNRSAWGDERLHISCDTCVARDTAACADCVVTYLCGPDIGTGGGGGVALDRHELATLRVLGRAGLAPALRHAPA